MIKSEKGSITAFVLITMMFFVTVLALAYGNQASQISNQKKQVAEIEKQYNVSEEELESEYNKRNTKQLGESRKEIFKVGDYIDYTPDETAQVTYSKELLTDGYTGSASNTSNLSRTNLNWQILKVFEDGSMDLIGTPTDFTVYFSGARGYNNGVYVMNDICEKLYSRKGIKARNINIDDMEECLTEDGKLAKINDITNRVNELTTGTYIINVDKVTNKVTYVEERSYYPVLWKEQINESEKHYKEETLIKEDELNKSYKQEEELEVKQTLYSIPLNETNYGKSYKVLNNSTVYWMASRYTNCISYYTYFGLRFASNNTSGSFMFVSHNYKNDGNEAHLRPIVSLEHDIPITPCEGENSQTNKHTINW